MVVVVHKKDDLQHLSDITTRVDGRQVPVEDVSSLSDIEKIKKVVCVCFLITSNEALMGTECNFL